MSVGFVPGIVMGAAGVKLTKKPPLPSRNLKRGSLLETYTVRQNAEHKASKPSPLRGQGQLPS